MDSVVKNDGSGSGSGSLTLYFTSTKSYGKIIRGLKMKSKTPPVPGGGLVLTRRLGEIIIIDRGLITVQIVEISGEAVRLRFTGKAEIHRKEVLDRILAGDGT